VQKFGRLTLIVLGALCVFAAVLLLGVNLYVQSQGTQARIQQELRHRFGTELNIHRISVTPWAGLKLSGISIPPVVTEGGANFLEAKNFGLRISFFSLFSRHLVIKEVSLIEPTVIWPQNGEGKWRLPDWRHPSKKLTATPEPAESATESATAETGTPTETVAPEKPKGRRPVSDVIKSESAPAFVSEIRHLTISRGNFRFLGRSNDVIANFEGVGFHSNITNEFGLRGSARVTKVSLRDRFFLQNLKSPLRYDDGGLQLPQIAARAGDGDISGQFSIQPETPDSPFALQVKFRNVQADQIISEAGGASGVLQGKLEGNLEATGKTADANALNGTGEIVLRDGQVRQYSLLVALGQIFQIEELMQLHLEQAHAKYHIAPGVVTIDELILQSQNIHLSATGTVSFGGKLHLSSRLAINEKIRAQLFKPIRANFHPTDEAGYSAVDFEVSGTLERPKTNLLEKVAGRDLKDLVNSFLGGKSDRPKKKKAAQPGTGDTESPGISPTPESSPAGAAASPGASP
jgi:type II secretion system protein N